MCGGRSGAIWLPSHHPGGCCTLLVDEAIPPFYVKRFEYPEKRYINVKNYYYPLYFQFSSLHVLIPKATTMTQVLSLSTFSTSHKLSYAAARQCLHTHTHTHKQRANIHSHILKAFVVDCIFVSIFLRTDDFGTYDFINTVITETEVFLCWKQTFFP